MNLQSLRYLAALNKQKHFGKAAEACFVSQPTLSMQIKKLEDELDLKLIERTNKSMLFTEAGKLIVAHAQRVLDEVQQIKDTARSIKDPCSGIIKLGIIPTLAPYLLPQIMPALKKHFPYLHYYLIEEKTSILVQQLHEGTIDACFLATTVASSKTCAHTLFKEPFLLAVSKTHPLAKQKHVTEKTLNHKELLLLEEGHCLREQALEVCENANAAESKSFRGTSLETIRHMVSSGEGMTLIPALACKKGDGTYYLPFSDCAPSRTINLTWRNTSARSQLLTEIASIIEALELCSNTI
jgi:LysR family hydrogen peroxide-inducible transcriptional activator